MDASEEDDIYYVSRCYLQKGGEVIEEFRANGYVSSGSFEPPNLMIRREDESYRIKWFDEWNGNVKRRGGNEDYKKKGAKLSRYPNRLNETAFVLDAGRSGIVRWNNRFTNYHGQWYVQYQAYFVNNDSDTINADVFVRDYDYDYQQLADLF